MKILHLSGATIWGGNEQQLVDLISNLNNKNTKNIIFCFKESPIEKYAKENGLNFISSKNSSPFSIKQANFLSKIVKEKNIDIIHIHTSNYVTTFMISDIINNLKTPTVLSKKGVGNNSSFLSPIKYNYKGINKIICVSNIVKEQFKVIINKKNHHKLEAIYDGIQIEKDNSQQSINLRKEYKISSEKIIIGNIANHSEQKDLGTFIKTANELVNNQGITNIYFVQIGKELKQTKKFIGLLDDYNLHKYFSFTGEITNAKSILSQFDIFLMTSKREGLPLTIYEAFLKRVPVVSTKAGGIPEAVIDNENGFLAEIGDYKKLSKNIIQLLNNPSLQKKFTENSYKKLITFFDANKLSQKTIDLYTSIPN